MGSITGSPPQVRGKQLNLTSTTAPLGITPAGAGKTLTLQPPISPIKDHPRRCGENQFIKQPYHNSIGSPPQVRGKRAVLPSDGVALRITPAGAGKTWHLWTKTAATEDHPRRCGENFQVLEWFPFHVGSPPQVRGKQSLCRRFSAVNRITPAGAGKTHYWLCVCLVGWDHPRRCGENTKKIL